MNFIRNLKGEIKAHAGRVPASQPKNPLDIPWSERVPMFGTRYAVDGSGQRVGKGASQPAPHRLWWQMHGTFYFNAVRPHGLDTFYNYPIVNETSQASGDKLICIEIKDLAFLLERYLANPRCARTLGAFNDFTCIEQWLSTGVTYSVGYRSVEDSGSLPLAESVTWLFEDCNILDAFSQHTPYHIGPESWYPSTVTELRQVHSYYYKTYIALKSGDKIVYRIKTANIDGGKNIGLGAGVEFVDFRVKDMSSYEQFAGWNSIGVLGPDNAPINEIEGRTYSNSLTHVQGPTNQLSGINVLSDAELTDALGENTWSATIK